MVANISGCETMSSAAMVHCLRKKPEEEIILKYQLQKVGGDIGDKSISGSYRWLLTEGQGQLLSELVEHSLV